MDDKIEGELAAYEARLDSLGFHPATVRAYSRKLREFLEADPRVLDAGDEAAADAIGAYIDGAGASYDDFARNASLRKWHLLRFGRRIGRRRANPADYATSPQIEAEAARLRARLESDGAPLLALGSPSGCVSAQNTSRAT